MASRSEAASLIDEHRVLVNGAIADKSSRLVDPGDAVVVSGPPARFVSRGGEKLDHALNSFAIDVVDRVVLDAGASTGGFTDCLLQRGARRVIALDVGHGQLHPKIRHDDRVDVIERVNVRDIEPEQFGGRVDLLVADLSFISLTVVAPSLVGMARDGADLVVLVKPQFEVGRREASRGQGVVTDPALHRQACDAVSAAFEEAGADVLGLVESPITGGEGNKEFLLHARVRARLSE